ICLHNNIMKGTHSTRLIEFYNGKIKKFLKEEIMNKRKNVDYAKLMHAKRMKRTTVAMRTTSLLAATALTFAPVSLSGAKNVQNNSSGAPGLSLIQPSVAHAATLADVGLLKNVNL